MNYRRTDRLKERGKKVKKEGRKKRKGKENIYAYVSQLLFVNTFSPFSAVDAKAREQVHHQHVTALVGPGVVGVAPDVHVRRRFPGLRPGQHDPRCVCLELGLWGLPLSPC